MPRNAHAGTSSTMAIVLRQTAAASNPLAERTKTTIRARLCVPRTAGTAPGARCLGGCIPTQTMRVWGVVLRVLSPWTSARAWPPRPTRTRTLVRTRPRPRPPPNMLQRSQRPRSSARYFCTSTSTSWPTAAPCCTPTARYPRAGGTRTRCNSCCSPVTSSLILAGTLAMTGARSHTHAGVFRAHTLGPSKQALLQHRRRALGFRV